MATNFPGGYDTFVNPTASPPGTDKLSTIAVKHSSQHTNLNDAVTAIEHAFGLSGTTSGVHYSLNQLSGQVTTINATISGSSGGAPVTGGYLVLGTLTGTAARTFTLGAGLSGTDAGSGSTYTVGLSPTGVTSGTYSNMTATVNAQGQVLSAATGATYSMAPGSLIPLMSSGTVGVTSQWYDCGLINASAGARTSVNGGIEGGSIVASRTCTLSDIGIQISVGVAGGAMYLGCYEEVSSANGIPGSRIYGSSLITATGTRTYSEAATGTLVAGRRYWFVMHVNSNIIQVTSVNASALTNIFGRTAVNGAPNATMGIAIEGNQTFGTLPATFPTTGIVFHVTLSTPQISFRVI